MPTCAKGHTSTATDYCDECGTPISGAPAPAATPTPPAPASASAASPASTALPASTVEAPGELCPECAAPRDGRFCEVCGHDFLAEPSANPSAVPASAPNADAAASAAAPATGGPAKGWRIVVTADRAYHARMQADPAADHVPFPAYCPERRFVLTGSEMLIGRRSRSRGIEPAIDLTGPPEDTGASHVHALLVATPEGPWTVVDLDSANGTYVNDGADPIAANQPVPLADGDRVHVGAWTTLTLQAI
jgi:hypothetical protein